MSLTEVVFRVLRICRYTIESAFWAAKGSICRFSRRNNGELERLGLDKKDWGKVAVIGRGKSAEMFCSSESRFDVVILCNFRDSDLGSARLLQSLSEAKSIFLLSNIYESVISCKLLRLLPVSEVIWTGFFDNRLPERKLVRGRLKSMGLRVKALPEDFEPHWLQGFEKNTGISAVRLASLRSQDVSLFGIEFYSTDHLHVRSSDKRGYGLTRPEYGAAVMVALERVMEDFPKTNYTITTYSKHNLRAKNLRVLQVSPPQSRFDEPNSEPLQ